MRVERPRPKVGAPSNARGRGVQVDWEREVGQAIFGGGVAWPYLVGIAVVPAPQRRTMHERGRLYASLPQQAVSCAGCSTVPQHLLPPLRWCAQMVSAHAAPGHVRHSAAALWYMHAWLQECQTERGSKGVCADGWCSHRTRAHEAISCCASNTCLHGWRSARTSATARVCSMLRYLNPDNRTQCSRPNPGRWRRSGGRPSC